MTDLFISVELKLVRLEYESERQTLKSTGLSARFVDYLRFKRAICANEKAPSGEFG